MSTTERYHHLAANLAAAVHRVIEVGPLMRCVRLLEGLPILEKSPGDWDICFIRGDGWTLGAPHAFERQAYQLWRDDWIAFMHSGDTAAIPIAEYTRSQITCRPSCASFTLPPEPCDCQSPPAKTCPRCGSPCEKRTRGRWDLEWRWACLYCTWTDTDG